MAKKKTTGRPAKTAAATNVSEGNRETFQFSVRIPLETHRELVEAAGRVGVSLNTVVEGILEACTNAMHEGDAGKDDKGTLRPHRAAGMLWFGRQSEWGYSDPDMERAQIDPDVCYYAGSVWFKLKLAGSPVIPGD